jgi:hypothetical protein
MSICVKLPLLSGTNHEQKLLDSDFMAFLSSEEMSFGSSADIHSSERDRGVLFSLMLLFHGSNIESDVASVAHFSLILSDTSFRFVKRLVVDLSNVSQIMLYYLLSEPKTQPKRYKTKRTHTMHKRVSSTHSH